MQSHSYTNRNRQEAGLLHYYRQIGDVARREFIKLVAALAPEPERFPQNVIPFRQ